MDLPSRQKLILFDGYCHLCSRLVRLVLKYDRREVFLFSSLESEAGLRWRKKMQIPADIDSMVVIDGHHWYNRSDAVLKVCETLGGGFRLLLAFKLFPRSFRDRVYNFVARNRLRWFGRRDSCMLPARDQQKRFL